MRSARVDLATITLHVTTIPPAAAADVSNDIPGFLRGLDTGAAAFGNTVLVIATALGFALPFLAVALLAAIPFWYFTRRRRFATAGVSGAPVRRPTHPVRQWPCSLHPPVAAGFQP